MSSQERDILVRDSRSENMIRRLIQLPDWLRGARQRRLLLAASGCIQRTATVEPSLRRRQTA